MHKCNLAIAFRSWIKETKLKRKNVALCLDVKPQTLNNWLSGAIPKTRRQQVMDFMKGSKDHNRNIPVGLKVNKKERERIRIIEDRYNVTTAQLLRWGIEALLDLEEQEGLIILPIDFKKLKESENA